MTTAARWTVIGGVVLIVIAVAFYAITGAESWTALIPAFFGLPLALCGLAARTPRSTKIAMHIAVIVAAVGVAGGLRIVPNWADSSDAVRAEHLLLIAICAALVVMYVGSFVSARRRAAPSPSDACP